MRIAVCGLSSSGKSTLAKRIAKEFNLELYSSGEIFREIAKQRGLRLEELSKATEKEIDIEIDEKTKRICKEKDNFVIEGRLPCFFCKDSFKIYLHAPLNVRVRRCALRDGILYEDALKLVEERDMNDLRRYKILYGIDDYDKTMKEIADLVIDTERYSIEEMCSLAFEAIREHISFNP